MKNLKLIALALAIGISTMSFATIADENPNNELRQQIIKILGKTINKLDENKVEAEVVFTLNNKSEIVIVSVNTDNQLVETFVKGKLNYQKVEVKAFNEGKLYKMPLTIVNE